MVAYAQTLLVSQSYEPLRLIPWQRAFTLLTLGKVEVIEEYDRDVRSATVTFKLPAVVRLLRAFRRFRKPVRFSRANIYARDRHRCQYCGRSAPLAELTYDHVVPRAQGGKTTWTNIVTACFQCNRAKGARTPEQAGMQLLSQPVRPTWIPAVTIRVSTRSVPQAWRDYMYWTGDLGE